MPLCLPRVHFREPNFHVFLSTRCVSSFPSSSVYQHNKHGNNEIKIKDGPFSFVFAVRFVMYHNNIFFFCKLNMHRRRRKEKKKTKKKVFLLIWMRFFSYLWLWTMNSKCKTETADKDNQIKSNIHLHTVKWNCMLYIPVLFVYIIIRRFFFSFFFFFLLLILLLLCAVHKVK